MNHHANRRFPAIPDRADGQELPIPMTAERDDMDDEQSVNLYREAALKILPLIDAALAHILAAKSIGIGRAQVMFALNLEERSMHSVAAAHGVTAQCISRGMKEFVRDNDLPQPLCAKSEQASASYRTSRISNLNPQHQ